MDWSLLRRRSPEFDRLLPAISVRDLSVQYDINFNRKRTLREGLARTIVGNRRQTRFWALRNLSFDVPRGEAFGIIGPNGAGKSTLLSVLARIIPPTTGEVILRGDVSALLTLGAGMEPEMTGRENVYLGGAFLGLHGREMDALFPEIEALAGIGEFIDAPVKTYSTGMRSRLSFSLATALQPDLLLLDEVLSAGDVAFAERARQRMDELLRGAGAVVAVSHNLKWVADFCSQAMLLDKGNAVAIGPAAEVVELYKRWVKAAPLEDPATSAAAARVS